MPTRAAPVSHATHSPAHHGRSPDRRMLPRPDPERVREAAQLGAGDELRGSTSSGYSSP